MKRRKMESVVDWHVTLRGAKRLFLFREDEDYLAFYGLMGNASKRTGVSMTSQCLMSNHLHLNPRADSGQLSEFMWRTGKGFADYHNRKYKMAGHVFDRPYYAGAITNPFFLIRVTRYIHLNPVRGGKATRPEDYPWSSCNSYFTGKAGPYLCNRERVLRSFDPGRNQALAAYRRFVLEDLSRPVSPAGSRNPAIELWQEQFRWLREFAEERRPLLDPIDPAQAATYWAREIGLPPRAIAKARGLQGAWEVYNDLRRLERQLDAHPELKSRLVSLGIAA